MRIGSGVFIRVVLDRRSAAPKVLAGAIAPCESLRQDGDVSNIHGVARTVKSPGIRKLALPLTLVCAGTQLASGSALLASLLTLGLHDSDHAHSVSLVADEGHVHLVLSHEEQGTHHSRNTSHHGDPATTASERDHVFHLTDDDAASTTRHRPGFEPAPLLAAPVAVFPASTPSWLLRASSEPRARSSDLLRTVVLRL